MGKKSKNKKDKDELRYADNGLFGRVLTTKKNLKKKMKKNLKKTRLLKEAECNVAKRSAGLNFKKRKEIQMKKEETIKRMNKLKKQQKKFRKSKNYSSIKKVLRKYFPETKVVGAIVSVIALYGLATVKNGFSLEVIEFISTVFTIAIGI